MDLPETKLAFRAPCSRMNCSTSQTLRFLGNRKQKVAEDLVTRDMLPSEQRLQQWLLATYLIPGCLGRGVKLGSDSSSGSGSGDTSGGGGFGVWKSPNHRIWESGNLEIWKYGILKNQKLGNLSEWTSILSRMLARSWLVGKQNLMTLVSAISAKFSMGRKNVKITNLLRWFSLWVNKGSLAPIHPWWEN